MLWLLSLILVLAAIILHTGALGAASKRVDNVKRAMIASEPEKQALEAEAKYFSQKSDSLIISGWVAAAISLGFLFASYRKEEPAARSIVVVLLAFYLLLQFGTI